MSFERNRLLGVTSYVKFRYELSKKMPRNDSEYLSSSSMQRVSLHPCVSMKQQDTKLGACAIRARYT